MSLPRILKPCAYRGCGSLIDRGISRCPTHTIELRIELDNARASSHQRGYDAAWRRLRHAFLMAHPLCECEDCNPPFGLKTIRAAEVVDHIQPIAYAPHLRLVWSNLRAMTKRCHDRHTARTQGYGRLYLASLRPLGEAVRLTDRRARGGGSEADPGGFRSL